MPRTAEGVTSIKPQKAIRRFDVFAEFNRLDALKDGRPEDEARGNGIWLAKVVASRRSGAKSESDASGKSGKRLPRHPQAPVQFKSVGDELQTDETFEHEIVDRMGRDFYQKVFAPAIRRAFDEGQKYEEARDAIRTDWKPQR